MRVISPNGSICWEVGKYVDKGEVFPLDIFYYQIFKKIGLQLRNRIIWRFGHGLHASNRFSERYETILWFTKSDDYTFNLDAVRAPSKYPGKRYFMGPNKGHPSGNPLGKNPSDIRTTIHEDDWILYPFAGVGSTLVAALKNKHNTIRIEKEAEYCKISAERVKALEKGCLKTRPIGQKIHEPSANDKAAAVPEEWKNHSVFGDSK